MEKRTDTVTTAVPVRQLASWCDTTVWTHARALISAATCKLVQNSRIRIGFGRIWTPAMPGPVHLQPEEILAEYDWLRGLARSLVADAHLAEDAVHETYIRALHSSPDDRSRLRQWLSSILRNFVRQQARSDRARQAREANAGTPAALGDSNSDLVARVSVQQTVVAIVLKLDAPYRSVVLLRFFAGLPQREIAQRLGVPVATVNSRLTRALAKIRGELDRESGGDRSAWQAALAPMFGLTGFSTTTYAMLGVTLMHAKLQLTAAVILVSGLIYVLWPPPEASLAGPTLAAPGEATAPASSGEPVDTTAPNRELVSDSSAPGAERSAKSAHVARGMVLFATGSPAANVAVGIADSDALPVRSDQDGRFQIQLESDAAKIISKDPAYVTVLQGACNSSGDLDTVLVVAPPIEIEGQVVSSSGRAIVGARIAIRLPDDFDTRLTHVLDRTRRMGWQAKSDENGHFLVPTLPAIAGLHLVVTRAPFHSAEQVLAGYTDRRVYIVLGEDGMEDGPVLIGCVIDSDGVGVPNALVAAGLTSTVTDENGNFHVVVRRAGKPKSIRAIKKGYGLARFIPDEDVDGELQWPDFIALRMPNQTFTISGRVLDTAKKPVAGALVWTPDASQFGIHGVVPIATEYVSGGGELPRGRPLPKATMDAPLAGDSTTGGMWHAKEPSAAWFYVRTDADGRFTLPGLADKSYRIAALQTATALQTTTGPIAAGSTGIDIEMKVEDVHEFVAGTLVLPDGSPAPRVSISVFCNVRDTEARVPGGHFKGELIRHGRRTKTDDKGWFQLDETPAQGVRLSIYGDGIIPRFFRLKDDSDVANLRIVVTPRHHLQVIMTAADSADSISGEDESGARTLFSVIRSGSMSQRRVIQLNDGRTGVLVVPHSLRTIVFLKDGKEVGRQSVTLVLGEKCIVRR